MLESNIVRLVSFDNCTHVLQKKRSYLVPAKILLENPVILAFIEICREFILFFFLLLSSQLNSMNC